MSVPMASGTWNAATAAAEPPLLPPGTRSRSQGLAVGPQAECSVDEPIANSSMLVLPGHDRPGGVEPLGDVRVVGADEALQDPAAGRRRLAARHHEVLERDRDAEQRRQRGQRAPPAGPGRPPQVGRRPRPRGAPRPLRRATPRRGARGPALDQLEVRVQQLERAEVAGAQAAPPSRAHGGASASVSGGRRSGLRRPPVADDRRHHEVAPGPLRRAGQRHVRREARRDHVLAQDVLDLDRLRRRRDVVGRQLGQHRVLVEDVVELALEAVELLLGQAEAGEVGDVLDVRALQKDTGARRRSADRRDERLARNKKRT